MVSAVSPDRAVLSEERQRPLADALGYDAADSFHAAMVRLLGPGNGRSTPRYTAVASVYQTRGLRRRDAALKHHTSLLALLEQHDLAVAIF